VLGVVAQLLLTATVCGIFYKSGEHIAARFLAFARRLGGDNGEQVAVLASRSVRGVATGVVVTAVIQTILTAIALSLADVPGVGLLAGIAFLLCLAQLGPTLVLLAATGWLYWSGQITAAIVMLVASFAIGALDNILRPILIKKGADLPLLLVFAGVIGGIFAFGILGVFVGPVLLAVTKTLFDVWLEPPPALPAEG
jgi:predicted PurR-regulated permease PerM